MLTRRVNTLGFRVGISVAGAIALGLSLLVVHCDWLLSKDPTFEPQGFGHGGLSSMIKPPKSARTGADEGKDGTPMVAVGWSDRAARARVGDGR